MLRRPLAFALATALLPAALLPAAAQADDLLQSYHNARNSDPQYAAAESSRAIAAERPVQAVSYTHLDVYKIQTRTGRAVSAGASGLLQAASAKAVIRSTARQAFPCRMTMSPPTLG